MSEEKDSTYGTQRLVVGVERDGVFTPCEEQPDGAITKVVDMLRWCRVNLMENGAYTLKRDIPVTITVNQTRTVDVS